jgi:hypothetical protein
MSYCFVFVYHLVLILLNAIFFVLDHFLKSFFFQFYFSIFDWLGIEFYDFFQWCFLVLMTQVTSLKG